MRPTEREKGTSGAVFGESEQIDDHTGSERVRMFADRWIITPFQVIWSDWRARVGISILLVYVFLGTVGVWWLVPAPKANQGPLLLMPFQSMQYPLGTDRLGQGLLRALIHAIPPMFKMIFAGAVFATTVATLVGIVAGYKGGMTDRLLMTITDVMMTIPGLTLVVVLAALLEPQDPFVVGVMLSIHRWAGFARSLRAQTLTLREESYVEASRAIDLSTLSIVSKDLIPNLAPLIAVYFMNTSRGIIFSSVGLYFLGILPFTTLNWGVMMNLAYRSSGALYSWKTAHSLIEPMFAIVFLSLGLILFAQGMDRLFNPRIRAKHESGSQSESTGDDRTVSGEVFE